MWISHNQRDNLMHSLCHDLKRTCTSTSHTHVMILRELACAAYNIQMFAHTLVLEIKGVKCSFTPKQRCICKDDKNNVIMVNKKG